MAFQNSANNPPSIELRNDGSFLEQFKRMQQAQLSSSKDVQKLNPPPSSSAAAVASYSQQILPGTIKNDGSFLEKFKNVQKQSQTSQPIKQEVKEKSNLKVAQQLAFRSRFLTAPKKEKPAAKITDVFDLDYDRKYFLPVGIHAVPT
ncbi:hypothetical protein EB796_021089 [Bugula neritina]|uniref:Uncharacterized protein n=1 Tax=Bugula neritina TaxID=10212 RepID=A0A7J7J363_BUGNE|nr:hypothetical protein EB796_021089 [Bugula neritina]